MIDGNSEKPQTDAQESRALAQQLGKLAALVLLVIVALLIERYCSHKLPRFGPGVKIVSIDGDTLRAGDGSEYSIFGTDAPACIRPARRPTASPGPAAARPRRGSPP